MSLDILLVDYRSTQNDLTSVTLHVKTTIALDEMKRIVHGEETPEEQLKKRTGCIPGFISYFFPMENKPTYYPVHLRITKTKTNREGNKEYTYLMVSNQSPESNYTFLTSFFQMSKKMKFQALTDYVEAMDAASRLDENLDRFCNLVSEMAEFVEKESYEDAADVRDEINSLRHKFAYPLIIVPSPKTQNETNGTSVGPCTGKYR